MTSNNRVQYIDIAKGIAMICIILGHLGISQINKIVFTFHVPIFYFITGYFIKTTTSKKDFIWKKFRTLMIPYACTCMVIIIWAAIDNELFIGGGTKQVILQWIYASFYGAGGSYSEPFYIKQLGAIWFLWATFWGSTFLRCILDLKKEYRIIAVLLLFGAGYWSRNLFWFPFSIQAGCCAVLFMYLGYLLNDIKPMLKNLTLEIKTVWTLLALGVWICFMRDFQSFWLVHCDVGRGAVDILGCICGCCIVMLISWYIEQRSKLLTRILSYLGNYSIFMLCVHTIEFNLFPWNRVTDLLQNYGMPAGMSLYVQILGKFILIISVTIICSKWNFTRQIFGFPKIEGLRR